MCVAIVMILLIGRAGSVASWALILAAFAGAMVSTGFILLVARSVRHMAALLVAGIMIGYICSAVTEFLVTFAEDTEIIPNDKKIVNLKSGRKMIVGLLSFLLQKTDNFLEKRL